MRSGLSASKYIRNNKRTCFVLIIALALTFMAMYIVNYLLKVTEESFKPPLLELPKHVTYADLTPQALGIDPADYTAEDGSLSRDYPRIPGAYGREAGGRQTSLRGRGDPLRQ